MSAVWSDLNIEDEDRSENYCKICSVTMQTASTQILSYGLVLITQAESTKLQYELTYTKGEVMPDSWPSL